MSCCLLPRGQFARFRVAEHEWRDYSIAAADGRELTLLVSTRTGGCGSQFAERVAVGQETLMELPLGEFRLVGSSRRRVFVATGTGLAPLLPMMAELRRPYAKLELLLCGKGMQCVYCRLFRRIRAPVHDLHAQHLPDARTYLACRYGLYSSRSRETHGFAHLGYDA